MKKLWFIIPLVIVLAIVVLFFLRFSADVTYMSDGVVLKECTGIKFIPFKLPQFEPPEGYVFMGWRGDNGVLYKGRAKITADTVFTAEYHVTLDSDKHSVYLFPNEDGFYRPNSPLTRGDACKAFYSLLAAKVRGSAEPYLDDDSAEGKAMKTVGLFDGDYLYPERELTKAEFKTLVTEFFPDSAVKLKNRDDLITRAEAASVLNGLLGRKADSEQVDKMLGCIPDADPENEFYYDFAEAALGHEYKVTDGAECWTKHDSFKKMAPGLQVVNGHVYCIDDNGLAAIDKTVNNMYFDLNGRYTSGDEVLDELVDEEIAKYVTDDTLESIDKLRIMYNHIVDDFGYRTADYYEKGTCDWTAEAAYKFLVKRRGNCYSYAASFAEIARHLGYFATAWSGYVAPYTPHGWVEVIVDGETFYCDPEIEMNKKDLGQALDMFMINKEAAAKWAYNRKPETVKAPEPTDYLPGTTPQPVNIPYGY